MYVAVRRADTENFGLWVIVEGPIGQPTVLLKDLILDGEKMGARYQPGDFVRRYRKKGLTGGNSGG